jgi:hypothetical protein
VTAVAAALVVRGIDAGTLVGPMGLAVLVGSVGTGSRSCQHIQAFQPGQYDWPADRVNGA